MESGMFDMDADTPESGGHSRPTLLYFGDSPSERLQPPIWRRVVAGILLAIFCSGIAAAFVSDWAAPPPCAVPLGSACPVR